MSCIAWRTVSPCYGHLLVSRWLSLIVVVFFSLRVGSAQESSEADHHEGLHFSHPLIAESVSPDTKIRIDYDVADLGLDDSEQTIGLELEYAFHRAFSIEAGIPFTRLDLGGESGTSRFGNAEVALKFANYAFEDRGVLLGYGVEFGLPTGSDDAGIGSDHIVEVEPFFNIGFKRSDWELVAFTTFGIPRNQEEGEEVETELATNLSTLYHVNPRLQLLLEFYGTSVLSGEESGEQVWHVTPGVKFAPVRGSRLFLGVGVRVPLTDDQEFDTQALVTLFYRCFRHQVLLRRDRHVHDRSSGPPSQVSEYPHVAQPRDKAPQGQEDVPKRQSPRGEARLHRGRPRLASELQRPMRANEVVVAA